MMFGYACDETPELMPLPIMLAHRISRRMAEVRKDGTLAYLRPDGKIQVTVRYRQSEGRLAPVAIERLLVSTQHDPTTSTRDDPRGLRRACASPGSCRRSCAHRRAWPSPISYSSTPPGGSWRAARWATPA